MSSRVHRNCIEIIEPFVEDMRGKPELGIQIIGGVGSAALAHPNMTIDIENEQVVAPSNLHVPQFRNKRFRINKRDLDVLVLSDDPEAVEEVESIAQQSIGQELKISVFGLKKATHLEEQTANPFGVSALKTFVSDRYTDGTNNIKKGLFPFSLPYPEAAQKTWSYRVGEFYFPGPHPGMCIANYYSRSISGLRPKDADKVQDISTNVFAKSPEILQWLTKGDGAPLLDFADILHSLREPKRKPRPIDIGGVIQLTPDDPESLINNPAFMLKDTDEATQMRAIRLARTKARFIYPFEKIHPLVSLWQMAAEPFAGFFIKNN